MFNIIGESSLITVIHTQFRENYATHNWDGEGEAPQYWKCKGGATYYIEAPLSPQEIEELTSLISYSDDYYEEHVISWLYTQDINEEIEDWETPTQIIPPHKENDFWGKIEYAVWKYGPNDKPQIYNLNYSKLVKGGQHELVNSKLVTEDEDAA